MCHFLFNLSPETSTSSSHTYKAEREGITVERVDPAYTSQECPVCGKQNKAQDRHYCCSDCGWKGHRDSVGAIAISRRTGKETCHWIAHAICQWTG